MADLPPPNAYRSRAVNDIVSERCGQVAREGFYAEADDAYTDGQLANAAAAYALVSALPDRVRSLVSGIYSIDNLSWLADIWPFPKVWWKPKDRRRDLVRAGALIVAEIERLDRAADKAAGVDHG